MEPTTSKPAGSTIFTSPAQIRRLTDRDFPWLWGIHPRWGGPQRIQVVRLETSRLQSRADFSSAVGTMNQLLTSPQLIANSNWFLYAESDAHEEFSRSLHCLHSRESKARYFSRPWAVVLESLADYFSGYQKLELIRALAFVRRWKDPGLPSFCIFVPRSKQAYLDEILRQAILQEIRDRGGMDDIRQTLAG